MRTAPGGVLAASGLVEPGDCTECLLRLPCHVGVGDAVLVVRQGADEAERGGVDVMAWVLAVGGEWETEGHDERPVEACLVEQLELIDEKSGLDRFVSGVTVRTRIRANRRIPGR